MLGSEGQSSCKFESCIGIGVPGRDSRSRFSGRLSETLGVSAIGEEQRENEPGSGANSDSISDRTSCRESSDELGLVAKSSSSKVRAENPRIDSWGLSLKGSGLDSEVSATTMVSCGSASRPIRDEDLSMRPGLASCRARLDDSVLLVTVVASEAALVAGLTAGNKCPSCSLGL